MNIILDTNIFRNDLFLKSQDFEVLKDYLEKTDSNFVMPQIILEEIKGVYKRTLEDNLFILEKNINQLNQNLNHDLAVKPELDVENAVKNYIEFIFKELKISEKNIIQYQNEYLPEIVNRAINRQKPFRDGDEGFRDSIIWLTILDHCKISHEKQVIFISNNLKDFGDLNNKTELHETLKKECYDLGIKVNYFRTPKDFIERHSSKIDFINYDWLAENVSDDWLSDIICDEINHNRSFRVTSWYERTTSNESTDHYSANRAHIYSQDNLFLYEMVDGKIVINFTISAEVEVDFDYYDYGYYGLDRYEYSSVNTETKYIDCEIYLSVIYQDDAIQEIEISDIGF